MKKYIIRHKQEFILRIVLSVIGILFVCLFSYSTSPLYSGYYGGDSAQFLTIGKAWMLGKIPYKEMFDHKGPFIFFIDMLGFMITGNKSGVAIIQSVFIVVTVNALFSLAKLTSDSNRFGVIVVLISLIIYKRNYVDGNGVEEYCLPLIAVSTYYQIRFFYHKFKEHSPHIAVFYGITFGVCAMTRITNSIMICSGVFVIAIMLLVNKNYLNFGRNALGFVLGFVVVCFPFAVYFSWHDCFSDFIYGTFTFNFEYSNKMESWLKYIDFSSIVTFFKFYFSYWCVAIAALFALWRKAYNIVLFYMLAFMLETYLFMSGQLFLQYPGICLPQVALLLNELYQSRFREPAKGIIKLVIILVIMIICAYSVRSMAYSLNIYHVYQTYDGIRGGYEHLLTQIPDEETDSFVAYGDNRFKELYLAYDLMPSYKYFVIQEWHASFSDYVKNDIYSIFENGDVKWIITAGRTENISDILNERYILYDSIDDYMLYRLR